MSRRRKLVRVRKPRLRITSKGIKMSKPSVRVGGKTGVNIGKRGVSVSTRGKGWSLNSRRGLSVGGTRRAGKAGRAGCGCLLPVLLCMGAVLVVACIEAKATN